MVGGTISKRLTGRRSSQHISLCTSRSVVGCYELCRVRIPVPTPQLNPALLRMEINMDKSTGDQPIKTTLEKITGYKEDAERYRTLCRLIDAGIWFAGFTESSADTHTTEEVCIEDSDELTYQLEREL